MRDRQSSNDRRRVIYHEIQLPVALLFCIIGVVGLTVVWTWMTDVIALVVFTLILGFTVILGGIGAWFGGCKGCYLDLPHRRVVLHATHRIFGPTVILRVDEIERLTWEKRSEDDGLFAHLHDGRRIRLDPHKAGGVPSLVGAIRELRDVPLSGYP